MSAEAAAGATPPRTARRSEWPVGPERLAWSCGLAGLAVAALGWLIDPRDFHYAWLAALATWLFWPLGSLALLLVHVLTGGRWGDAVRSSLRAGLATLPLLLPALVPLLLGLSTLYAWARPAEAAHLANHFYLNPPFFYARGVAYLVVWSVLALLTLRGAGERLAPPGLVLLAITFTFAVIDLTMSLDPSFNSSAYGMIQGAGAVLFALAIAALPAAAAAKPDTLADIGKMLLSLVVLWAYLDFMQYLIVWESDLASDASWYVRRAHGGWGWVMAALAAGHFLLPFLLLVFPRVQRSRRGIEGVALLLVAMEVLRGWWTVLPAAGRGVDWIDIGCALAFGGCGLGLALRAAAPHRSTRHV